MTRNQIQSRLTKILEQVAKAEADLNDLASEAQDAYDDRSDRWQESSAGDLWQEMVDELADQAAQLGEIAIYELPEVAS